MAVRQRRIVTVEPMDDAISRAVEGDNEASGETVADLLSDLRGALTDETKVLVYKKPIRGGQWEYLNTLSPPINVDNVLDELKGEYGGGEYQLRIFANGRVAKAKLVNISGPPKMPGTASERQRDMSSELIPMMMSQQTASSDRQMQMMMAMMTQQSQAADRQMQMMVTLLPALMGGKTDPLAMVQAIMSMKPDKENSLADTLALITAAKNLVSGEPPGEESLLQTGLKMFGPALANAAASMPQQQQAPAPAPQPMLENPQPRYVSSPGGGQPFGMSGGNVPGPRGHGGMYVSDAPIPTVMASLPYLSDPVLSVIGQDVLFFAARQYPPDIAAELTLNLIEKAGVAENDIMALVVRFTTSPDWIADLATQGIDLTQQRQWAGEYLDELVAQYTDNGEGDDDTSGGSGGESHAGPDAETSP